MEPLRQLGSTLTKAGTGPCQCRTHSPLARKTSREPEVVKALPRVPWFLLDDRNDKEQFCQEQRCPRTACLAAHPGQSRGSPETPAHIAVMMAPKGRVMPSIRCR